MRLIKCLLAACSLAAVHASAQTYVLTGTTYSQDFNTLATSGSNTWTNDSTLDGWSLFNSAGTAIATYTGGTGSANAGAFYSFGATGNSDRALGGLGSGSVSGYIVFGITNSSGGDFSQVSLSYVGEQWRNGGNATAQSMALQYALGSTYSGISTWTNAAATFNYSSPVATTTAAAVDGNVAGLVSGLGGNLSLTWVAGDTLWLRWVENNDAGNDHGLAIDNFSLTATAAAIPEPSTYAAIFGGLALAGVVLRRRLARRA